MSCEEDKTTGEASMEHGEEHMAGRISGTPAIGPMEPGVPARQGCAPALLGGDFRGPGAEQWGRPSAFGVEVMEEERTGTSSLAYR